MKQITILALLMMLTACQDTRQYVEQHILTPNDSENTLQATNAQMERQAKIMNDVWVRMPVVVNDSTLYLTFDDGPSVYTSRVLDVLEKHNVQATFFVLGKNCRGSSVTQLRRMKQLGCIIGNHTWDHTHWKDLTNAEIMQQIKNTSDAVERATGVRTYDLRVPWGNATDAQLSEISEYMIWHWTVNSFDYRNAKNGNTGVKNIVNTVLNTVQPGAIILMHDGGGPRDNTIIALDLLIPALQKQGWKFDTL